MPLVLPLPQRLSAPSSMLSTISARSPGVFRSDPRAKPITGRTWPRPRSLRALQKPQGRRGHIENFCVRTIKNGLVAGNLGTFSNVFGKMGIKRLELNPEEERALDVCFVMRHNEALKTGTKRIVARTVTTTVHKRILSVSDTSKKDPVCPEYSRPAQSFVSVNTAIQGSALPPPHDCPSSMI